MSYRLAAAHLYSNYKGTCISFDMSCIRTFKKHVFAGEIDFSLLNKNLTLKMRTENWKGVNKLLV